MTAADTDRLQQIEATVGALGAVVWEFDWRSGAFLFVSDACEQLLGFPKEQWMLPGFWAKTVHPLDVDSAMDYCRQRTEEGQDHTVEYRMIDACGATVWVRDIVSVDPDLRLDGLLHGILIDITDTRRKADHFESVFRLTGDLFFTTDGEGLIIDYAAPEQGLFVPPDVFLRKRLADVLPADAAAVLQGCTAEAHQTGRMTVGEYTLSMDDITSEWEARFLPLPDAETAIICREVTVGKRFEREISKQRDDLDELLVSLRASEERFRSVIEQAPIGIYLFELRGRDLVLVSANSAADRILRMEHAGLVGKTCAEAFPAGSGWAYHFMEVAVSGGEWRADVPYCDHQVEGVFDVTAFQAAPDQVAAMFMDVTERKTIEQADREHNRRVSALAAQIALAEDTERRRLAEELHDRVSQPLAVARMRLRASVAGCQHEPGEATQALEMLEQAIGETRTITTELYPPVLRELGLAPALSWLADDLLRLHGLRCHTRFDDSGSALVEEIQSFLFRSARELLTNVVKHSETYEAWLSLDCLGNEVALTVADEGCGFVPAKHGGPTAESGFGLFSITERIRYLGGTVEVESAPGEGARITLTVRS